MVRRGRRRSRYALHEGANQIGRNATAEVCLDDSTVSRHHARIVVTPAGVTLEDLGSRNGTFVNGAQATSPVRSVTATT